MSGASGFVPQLAFLAFLEVSFTNFASISLRRLNVFSARSFEEFDGYILVAR